MTCHWRIGQFIFSATILCAVATVGGRLVRFEGGYSYLYQYQANVTLDQVDTFRSAAKVFITNVDEVDDDSELLLEVVDFNLRLNDRSAAPDHRPDFTKWFSFIMSKDGQIKRIFYHVDEEAEILTVKKAIAGMLAGKFWDRHMIEESNSEDSWSYTTTELGHEGEHTSRYKVVQNTSGKTYSKERVHYQHPAPHVESGLEKRTYIDDSLGTIHSVSTNEEMTATHTSKPGFDPYYGMRKVNAINEFEQLNFPNLKAFSEGELRFIERKVDNRELKRPADIVSGHLHMPIENNRKSPFRFQDDVRQHGAYIQSNLTCMREKEERAGSRLDCFHNIVSIMRALSVKDLTNATRFYLEEPSKRNFRNTADQTAILDALGAMETNISQSLLTKYVLQRSQPDDAMVQRALIHIATMKEPPIQSILEFLQMALEDPSNFNDKYSLKTYHRTLLTIGSVANKLSKVGQNELGGKLAYTLQNMLGIHDPWNYREKRQLMSEEEQLLHDSHLVVLLEALGNGRHEDSYEYIISHLNSTNSHWVKRAGVHALRHYHNSNAAETLLDLALYDENEEVRYEAMLQYHSHPKAAEQPTMYLSRDNTTFSPVYDASDLVAEEQGQQSRQKRGIFDKPIKFKPIKFKLEAPSVDYQKHTGSTNIGGSFGVIMVNFLQLEIAPLTGLCRVAVHNEVYARVHLGFMGINLDFFSARVCFKGGTSYDVNILQEFDPRLNPKNIELITTSLKDIVDGIRTGVDSIRMVIDGFSSDMSLKTVVDDFLNAFRDLPNQFLSLRSTAVKIAREIGDLIVDNLPSFIQPVKDLVEHASNLLNKIKSDFMDFYNSVVQVVETIIPNAAETIYTSVKGIIDNFPEIFKDPKAAVARIGKAVVRIALTIQQLKMTKMKIENSVSKKVLPHFKNIGSEYEKLTEMVTTAYNSIKNKGPEWVEDFLDSEDPVAFVTGGKMSTADIRRRVVQKLQSIIDDLFSPFSSLRNLGQHYSDKFSGLFTLVSDVKMAYSKVKSGYKQARTVIETIFGPRCHKDFPRLFRLADEYCSGDGFYPSQLGRANTEYKHKGIDIITDSETIVAPFSGYVMLTENNNEVKFVNMSEMISGTEVIISNVEPLDSINLPSDAYFVRKKSYPRNKRTGYIWMVFPNTISGNPETISYQSSHMTGCVVTTVSLSFFTDKQEKDEKMPTISINEGCKGKVNLSRTIQSLKLICSVKVAAGDTIGSAIQSPCGSSNNHIHFTVLKNGEPIDPSRFLQPRPPSRPKWVQICDDYKVVYKFETVDAGALVGIGGRSEEDTSGHLPNDGHTLDPLGKDGEPKSNHDKAGYLEKIELPDGRKKRALFSFDTAENMIDAMVNTIEAFLDRFSISRITMGDIVSFVNFLELDNTKQQLKKTLNTLKNAINNKPCKTPDAMTTEEIQMELTVRGLTAAGGRRNMIDTLTSADERCPYLALGIPEIKHMYCSYEPSCLGIQCCLSLPIADIMHISYRAYAILDIGERSLSLGFGDWEREWHLEHEEVYEDTIRTYIQFELLDLEVLCRYKIEIQEHEIIVTFGAGLCSLEDLDVCIAFVNILEDAIFPLPKVLENGSIALQKVDWDMYFNKETVKSKFEEAGQSLVSHATDVVIDELLSILKIPKELLQDNPRCAIPENLSEQDLDAALTDKDKSTDGLRGELEQRLRDADRTCYPIDGHTLTLPDVENDLLRKYFYYTVSKDCLKIEACLDLIIEELNITKTFMAFIKLLPCDFQVNVGIEKWSDTYYLIDYKWKEVKKVKLTADIYISVTLDKDNDTNEFVLDAELVFDDFDFSSKFLQSLRIPIPGCNKNFRLPGKGDLISLAETIGGQLSEDAFKLFLRSIGIEDLINDQQCVLPTEATDCKLNADEYIPDSLKSILKCTMLENCWGVQCCIDFELDIPLSSKSMFVSIPFMFRYDPCQYFVEYIIGKEEHKEWLVDDWGMQDNMTIGKNAPITLSYVVQKLEKEFIIDVDLSICIPMAESETFCVPTDGVMHLIENERIPACLHELNFFKERPDFSITEWLKERGKMIGDEIGKAGKDYLIEKLNLKGVLLSESCDRTRHPFSPTVNGWKIGDHIAEDYMHTDITCNRVTTTEVPPWNACAKTLTKMPVLPDFLACHIDETCSHIVCCVDVDVIGFSLKLNLDIDVCGNSIVAEFENIMQKVDNALSKYEWGKENTLSLGNVLFLKYKIQKPGRGTYVIYAHVSACFERNGDCFLSTTLFDGMEIPLPVCTATSETCMVFVENIKHQCAMDVDCMGITCEVLPATKPNLPEILVSFRMDPCMNEIIITVDNKKWKWSLSSIIMDETYKKSVNDDLGISFTLRETAVEFRVDVFLSVCGYYETDGNCLEMKKIFTDLPLKKKNCEEEKTRKKRDLDSLYKTSHLKSGIKELQRKQATNDEIDEFLESVTFENEQTRQRNYAALTVDHSDVDTSLLAKLKALGQNNPMSIPYKEPEIDSGFTVEINGADALIDMLQHVDEVDENDERAFVIGKGLTKKGILQLGSMLANMTIGDLEALLDLNNIDATVVHQIITDLTSLATELYSETIDAINSDKLKNAFESFDIVLRGHYNYPDVSSTFFEKSYAFPMGPVVVDFAFGAGCAYGFNAGVGLKVMNMIAEASISPKGSVNAYGGLGICFGPLCAELRLNGYIMDVTFPTTAEVEFSKFPLDVGLRMDLHLLPLRLVLAGHVKVRIRIPFCCSFSATIWKKNIWSYSSSLVKKTPLFHLTTKEKDPDPPIFTPLTGSGAQDDSIVLQHCSVEQVANLDYTEPAFQIEVTASDSLSKVRYFMDVGTTPGNNDVISEESLGGGLTKITKILQPTGVPLYFTIFAQNSQGNRSSVTCHLDTYDVTLPSGRFDADFASTSNPGILKASVVIQDDTPITEAYFGIGYGEWIYGDQVKRFTSVNLAKQDAEIDDSDVSLENLILERFTGMKHGRLIGEIMESISDVDTVRDCAAKCMKLPTYSCLSINYDFGPSGLCELLKSIEGQNNRLSQDGAFSHYERLGTGYSIEFSEKGLHLHHNFLYKFNLDITNSLGYRNIISTKGILTDFTTPEPGVIQNAQNDSLETIPCLNLIPVNRSEWKKYCIGVNMSVPNHRVIIDGEGSQTVFNGPKAMTDMQFTRITNYISANWNGFRDNETSIRGYTLAVGLSPCEDQVQVHHDPQEHHPSEKHWDYTGQIYPIPPPYTSLPDGEYFITVRALNKVMFGGPLSISVCHATPFVVDTSPPLVHEIYGLRYDESTSFLHGKVNISDPHSGIAEYDICFGKTSRMCDLLPWFKYATRTRKIKYKYQLPEGLPVWVRIRAVNNALLSAVGVADHPIILDSTEPFTGNVYDGPYFESDLKYSKETDMICFNWAGFYDPESGISKYMLGVGTSPGQTDVVRLSRQGGKQQSACLLLNNDNLLKHGNTYYGVVWAFNGAVNQRNASEISDGVTIDTSPPKSGKVVDGKLTSFVDQEFSSSKSSVELQWDGFSDPESGIKEYAVKVTKRNGGDWQTLKNWTVLPFTDTYASWNNFHHHHGDFIKASLKVSNGAMNDLTVDTNGVLIDLTAPVMTYLYDGSDTNVDLEFQSDGTKLSCVFEFFDNESGVESLRFQVHEKKNGQRKKIWPDVDDWDKYAGETTQSYSKSGLILTTGALYSVRVGVTNNAGVMAIHETNGVKLDLTKPKIKWLHVGVFSGEDEDLHNGYTFQTDHNGIKVSFLAVDPESGVVKITLKVGTSPGSDNIKKEMQYSGALQDLYVTDISLHDTDTSLDVLKPVYYVTISAYNGAGVQSEEKISTPIAVLPEDVPGIVYDGIHEEKEFGDVDYDSDSSSVSISFSGFQSTIHGISSFVWAVGTKPGLEDIQAYTENGIIHLEDNMKETGMSFSHKAQMPLYLEHGETYFATVRAITNGGNVLESASDGFVVDRTPGSIVFDSLTDTAEEITEDMKAIYMSDAEHLNYEWHYYDDQYKTDGVLDNIDQTWLSMGTYPLGENIKTFTEMPLTPTQAGRLSPADFSASYVGLPYVLNVFAKNKAGYTQVKTAPPVVIDISAPSEGKVICPDYIQPQGELKCSWSEFHDDESTLKQYSFALGTEEGLSDLISNFVVAANKTWFHTDVSKLNLSHGMTLFATVTAINSVQLEAYQTSNKIRVDSTPPSPGVVVELLHENIFDGNGKLIKKNITCGTAADCMSFDAVCQESLVSIDVAWQAFTDEESGLSSYQIAVGTTQGGVEIRDFTTIQQTLTEPFTYRVSGISLNGVRQVFVMIKGINGAGYSTTATSDGVYISYLSQGLAPLLPVGIWDTDPVMIGDIDYQTDTTTIGAAWDVDGDPCPAVQFEWAIERLDGKVIQDFISVTGDGIESNDQQNFQPGETYYSLLRVTNALGYQYVLRSNGVTIHNQPLVPGSVYDGDIPGYDLTIIDSKSTVTCNWDSFGVTKSKPIDRVLTGNLGNKETVPDNQNVLYYEVGLGRDRRLSDRKDDVAAFRNVGKETSVRFTDLNLIPGNAIYYCTVRAYSSEHSTATVTSNGFSVSFEGGVTAKEILISRYISTDSEIDVQWVSFESSVDMMVYYVAVSEYNDVNLEDCKRYVGGSSGTAEEETPSPFNIQNIKDVTLNTHVLLENLLLNHGQAYYVYVVGYDFSGECNMTMGVTTVDLTPPERGHMTTGPYYDMKLAFTPYKNRIFVRWEDYEDIESGIDSYELSLWTGASCTELHSEVQIKEQVTVGPRVRKYVFRDLGMERNTPYIVKMKIRNGANIIDEDESSPVLFDDSKPSAGKVVEGTNYRDDVVFWGPTDYIHGSFLHFPSALEQACPSRSISLEKDQFWSFLEMHGFQQPGGRIWNIQYAPERANYKAKRETLEIKMSRDTKHKQMLSAGIIRNADLDNGGTYEFKVRAAGGNGLAVTEVMFLDATLHDFQTFSYEEDPDWTDGLCSCCLEAPVTKDCPCSDCEAYILSLADRATEEPIISATNTDVRVPTSTATPKREGWSVHSENNGHVDGFVKDERKVKHKGCGLQIMSGKTPFVIVWCQFYNDTERDMEIRTELQFDPAEKFHSYKMAYSTSKEGLIETWELEVYIDGLKIQKFSGIPQFSNTTQFLMHVWNRDNYVPELSDVFDNWKVKAFFKELVFPPAVGELCRYGEVFQSGNNPIIRYEAGIGSERGFTDIHPFSKIISPCIPCSDNCSALHCDPLCSIATEQLTFRLDNLSLTPKMSQGNESDVAAYYLAVKAVLSSGENAVSYSNGFYVDTTPPTFNADVFMYIDVDQGDFTPVEFQGCNHTIKSLWLCEDDKSEIQDYTWAIGSTVGGTNIQEFISTGTNPFGLNNKLEGVLSHKSRYYITVTCKNEAGLVAIFKDTKGVEVLLEAPDSDKISGHIVGAESFDGEVDPPDSQKTESHETAGGAWDAVDPAIKRYEFCLGSSKKKMDDICSCIWVGYNESGSVEIRNGYLWYAGQKMYSLKELGQKAMDGNEAGKFRMETGRVIFTSLRVCNQAVKCTRKLLGTVTVTSKLSDIKTANGGSPLVFTVNQKRLKRDVEEGNINVDTPSDLRTGQTVVVSQLTDEELQEDYGSDASNEFVSYISNPNISMNSTERLLSGRIKMFLSSFSVVSVGQLSMTGPLVVSFPQISDNPSKDGENITMLVHWNPDIQEWQISSRTCINESDTVYYNSEVQRTSVKVCNTRAASEGSYFDAETHFALVIALSSFVNNAPVLQDIPVLTMQEDEGTLILQLVADDLDGDDVEFTLISSVNDFPSVASEMTLDKNGRFVFTPCRTCFGILKDIGIEITDRPQALEIVPLSSTYYITIEVQSVNNAPVIFLLNDEGDLLLHPDPTEPVEIYLENRVGEREKISLFVGAYDLDTNDKLTVSQKSASSGASSLVHIVPTRRDAYFDCNSTLCLNTTPDIDPNTMTWVLAEVVYIQETTYTGTDSVQIVVQDSEGTYSDPVTLDIIMLDMPCLHGGECLALGGGYTCSDKRRISDFFDNYACVCPSGWVGQSCDIDVNECDRFPCGSPYTCINQMGSYECRLANFAIAIIVVSVALILAVIVLFLCRHKLPTCLRNKTIVAKLPAGWGRTKTYESSSTKHPQGKKTGDTIMPTLINPSDIEKAKQKLKEERAKNVGSEFRHPPPGLLEQSYTDQDDSSRTLNSSLPHERDMGSLNSLRSTSTDSGVLMQTVEERAEGPLSANNSPLPSLLMRDDDDKESSSTSDIPFPPNGMNRDDLKSPVSARGVVMTDKRLNKGDRTPDKRLNKGDRTPDAGTIHPPPGAFMYPNADQELHDPFPPNGMKRDDLKSPVSARGVVMTNKRFNKGDRTSDAGNSHPPPGAFMYPNADQDDPISKSQGPFPSNGMNRDDLKSPVSARGVVMTDKRLKKGDKPPDAGNSYRPPGAFMYPNACQEDPFSKMHGPSSRKGVKINPGGGVTFIDVTDEEYTDEKDVIIPGIRQSLKGRKLPPLHPSKSAPSLLTLPHSTVPVHECDRDQFQELRKGNAESEELEIKRNTWVLDEETMV